jgi:hypothetical protein
MAGVKNVKLLVLAMEEFNIFVTVGLIAICLSNPIQL